MRYAINASNLHVGGGVQVAVSVVCEISLLPNIPQDLTVIVSREVDSNLRELGCNTTVFAAYEVLDTFGLQSLISGLQRRLRKFDAVFTIFGPLYAWPKPSVGIVGFAQPWIINPDNEIYHQYSWFRRLKTRLKFWMQSQFFRQADMLVVELEHVKRGLLDAGIVQGDSNVCVVHNCLSQLYAEPSRWQSVDLPPRADEIRLGFVGRNYPHKNTAIFPKLREVLHREHGLNVRFYVTFTEAEWAACTPAFRAAAFNVGPLLVAQCPAFYEAVDGVIFPSLLECFSATPLEAMAMARPLFASDRPFIRDVCEQHAYYCNPLDPRSFADAIAAYFTGESDQCSALSAAHAHALSFSGASERARQYLDCLVEMAEWSRLNRGRSRCVRRPIDGGSM